jgi:hypothetical protein
LSYCRKCQSQERDGGDAESMQSGTVVTMAGDSLPGCLCAGCSSW